MTALLETYGLGTTIALLGVFISAPCILTAILLRFVLTKLAGSDAPIRKCYVCTVLLTIILFLSAALAEQFVFVLQRLFFVAPVVGILLGLALGFTVWWNLSVHIMESVFSMDKGQGRTPLALFAAANVILILGFYHTLSALGLDRRTITEIFLPPEQASIIEPLSEHSSRQALLQMQTPPATPAAPPTSTPDLRPMHDKLFEESLQRMEEGDFEEALRLAEQVLDLRRIRLEEGDPKIAQASRLLARLRREIQRRKIQ